MPLARNPTTRRQTLAQLAAFFCTLPALSSGRAAEAPNTTASTQTLATAWRRGAVAAADHDPQAHCIGLLQLEWAAGGSHWRRTLTLPSRAHGLLPDGRGGCYAAATRPGDWLLHLPGDDAQPPQWLHPGREEASPRSLNGHVLLSGDGRWLYSTETQRGDGSAWLVRRDAHTLRTDRAWPLPGVDAHQMLLHSDGTSVLVAMGGIPRDARGRKVELERMAPALLRVDGDSGAVLQRWALDDPRLSIRHMAWSRGGDQRLLGIALQAEHDDPARRRRAPLLAVWDGHGLALPQAAGTGEGDGYIGDICAGPGGSFLLSAQRSGRALLWHPDAPAELMRLAELQEVCPLHSWHDDRGVGLLMGAARGVARWQAGVAHMLPWPELLAPDNHMALLD